MNEQDFYQLKIDMELYYKGDKLKIESLYRSGGLPHIHFRESDDKTWGNAWQDIMQDCSIDPPESPFEVKRDCVSCNKEGSLLLCDKKRKEGKAFIIDKGIYYTNCHDCEDYEPKKEDAFNTELKTFCDPASKDGDYSATIGAYVCGKCQALNILNPETRIITITDFEQEADHE